MSNRKSNKGFIMVNRENIEAIYSHDIGQMGIAQSWLILAYLVMSQYNYLSGRKYRTQAGCKCLKKWLSCGYPKASAVLNEIELVARENGLALVENKSLYCSRPWREFALMNDDYCFPISKLTLNRLLDLNGNHHYRSFSSPLALRLLILLHEHYDPISYWGFNPYTSICYEYQEFKSSVLRLDHFDLHFYKSPDTKKLFIAPQIMASLYKKKIEDITELDSLMMSELIDELINKGYLSYSALVFDSSGDFPEYRLYQSDKFLSNKSDSFKSLNSQMFEYVKSNGYTTIGDAVFSNRSVNLLLPFSRHDQTIQLKGVLMPAMLPADPETQEMLAAASEAYSYWLDLVQLSSEALSNEAA